LRNLAGLGLYFSSPHLDKRIYQEVLAAVGRLSEKGEERLETLKPCREDPFDRYLTDCHYLRGCACLVLALKMYKIELTRLPATRLLPGIHAAATSPTAGSRDAGAQHWQRCCVVHCTYDGY